MPSYRNIALSTSAVPIIVVAVIFWLSPKLLTGGNEFDASLTLSWAGIIIGYFGLLFSMYAALQVRAISNAYFFKVRSPDLQKKLSNIAKSIGEFATEPSIELRSQKFISESAVALRLAKRIRNKHVTKVADQAELALEALKENMKTSCLPGKSASQVHSYWELHQKISELIDELAEQLKDARAQ